MYIVILGAGAMGCLFGGRLSETGHEVVLVDVWPEHLDAINRHGLILETAESTRSIVLSARRVEQVEQPPDLLMVFTKSIHSKQAIESGRHLFGDDTWVLTLQNGLGNVEAIEELVPRSRIIVGTTTCPSDLLGPGRVRSLGQGHTRIFTADECASSGLERICQALQQAGLQCELAPNIFAMIWEKLAFNAAVNSLTAATGLSMGGLGATTEGRELASTIAKEVVAVANRKGVAAQESVVLDTLITTMRDHAGHLPSMLQDLRAGRKTEVEAINGAVVREAQALGMSVPTTETLYRLVRILEQAGLAQSRATVATDK
ncbi:MAG: 2-dehydropantoate 2-reductase [Candidatus Korobacteraceae bacterium]